MKRVSPYLKMRVLGAIEFAPDNTVIARIHHVNNIVFTDDNDQRFQFTWRTIQTWYSRYKKDGITTMQPRNRADKGLPRKVQPEQLVEAIDQVRASFKHGIPSSVNALNRDFTRWLEDEYNAREHSAIHMKPIDRFGLDLSRIRFLPPNEVSDELFFVEAHDPPDVLVML